MTDRPSSPPAAAPFGRDDVQVLERRQAYRGFFRVDVFRLRHRLFAGGWSGEMSRELFDRGHAAAVLLYDPGRDAVVLVEQFRVGALAADREPWLVEAVAGIVDPGETPEQVARRESVEEAGCTVSDLVLIGEFLPSPGGCSEVITLYCGRVDSAGAGGLHGLAEENEDIRVLVLPADEAVARADRNEIRNGVTLVALHWLARHRLSLRRRWAD